MRKAVFLSAIFFLGLLFSCKKDGELSPDFDNGNVSINFTDTFSIKTSLVREDSLQTYLSIYHLLGLYNDPFFGPTSSSIYTQILLTEANVDFGVGATLDSIVLSLDYEQLYGDSSTPMSINVYELSSGLDNANGYYSSDYVSYNTTPIGNLTFTPNLSDSVNLIFDSTTVKSHLRIKLNNTFGQSIIAADANGTNDLANNTSFTSFMKGLYITTVDSVGNTTLPAGAGSILSFDMNSSLSTITLYYNDTSSYNFTINTDAVKFSHFAHNYSGTDVEAHLNNALADTTVTYVSTMAGVKTKLEIPNINKLSEEGNVVINKAEIVFTIAINSEGNIDAIPMLSLTGINSSGEQFFLIDNFDGVQQYDNGGTIQQEGSYKTYTFDITRHVQQLVNSATVDYGMYLVAKNASITANRSVIGSENNLDSKIRLNITYSKL